MSKLVIYASEIKPIKSILGLFDGSEDFCVVNPWFQINGMNSTDDKKFAEIRKIVPGIYVAGIYIGAKHGNNPINNQSNFTSQFVIGYTTDKYHRKTFYIPKPYSTDNVTKKYKSKLQITSKHPDICDSNLCQLDYALCCAMDIIIICKILKLSLKKYAGKHDNTEFYNDFC